MYAWYRQLHPPTGVENCVYCNFTSDSHKQLIVTAGSQLTVYKLRQSIEVPTKDANEILRKDKLEQVGSWSLHGNVISMKHVRFANSVKDSLLLSFKDAKLSIIEFDDATREIKTSSLHYFEDDLLKDGSTMKTTYPIVAIDPENRCACMLLTAANIAILPFKSRESTGTADDGSSGSRGSVLASYEINLKEVDHRVQVVKDIQFLHGYYEPTLLILFESHRTWSGRIALRQDTCSIIAISLNVSEKLHPVIWSLASLPYDCKYALAVPKPIGGVLLFAASSMIYLNQSVPPHGVSLNCHTKNSTSFPLRYEEGLAITMDLSSAVFLSNDCLVLSLKNGDLYVISLIVDGMRAVRNFRMEKAAASVLTTCITILEDSFLFLGSRLGNSLLLKYTETGRMDILKEDRAGKEPASKRKRLNTAADWAAVDMDDLEVYGRDVGGSNPMGQLLSYKFEVSDSIASISPCGFSELGEPALLSEEFANQREVNLELVILSGKGKNGALSVLQRTLKPQVVTTFQLPGCTDMWTVKGPLSGEDRTVGDRKSDEHHGFLILTREDSTLILETGKEIMEVEDSGFCTSQTTIHCSNISLYEKDKAIHRYILQVCGNGVWLMEGLTQLQHIPLELGSPIVKCSVCDPYAIVLTSDGQVVILTLKLDEENEVGRLYCSNPSLSQTPQADYVHLYCDTSGLFITESEGDNEQVDKTLTSKSADNKSSAKNSSSEKDSSMTVDEEDELLYGLSESNVSSQSDFKLPRDGDGERSSPTEEKGATYWAVVLRANRNVEIYTIPDLSLVYVIKSFSLGHRLLVDSSASHTFSTSESEKQSDSRYSNSPPVWEVMMTGMGYKSSRPFLLARVGEELLIYEAFPYAMKSGNNRSKRTSLQIRFKKVDHGKLMMRSPGSYKEPDEKTVRKEDNVSRLRKFNNIGGYSGIFVCGPYPHWLFMTVRGALRCHPMTVDGRVTCFVPFHNVNCPRGFLYFNGQGELRICFLPTHLQYDSHWPLRRVPLRSTPHYIKYCVEQKIYAVVASMEESCKSIPVMGPEGEKEFEELEDLDGFVYPNTDKFYLELISPLDWQIIPNTRFEFDDFEHVTCMCIVPLGTLAYQTTQTKYLVVGTTNIMGEEMASRGRILIFEVIEVVPEPGQPLTKNKLKKIYAEEQKGPVTALCGVEGNLLAAIGQKIFVWRLDDNNSLRGVAFVDTQIYTHLAFNFKDFAVIGDIQKSITLLRYKDIYKTLSVVSRDVKPLEVYTAQLLVDGSSLGFLVSDRDKNLVLFVYNSEAIESQGGTRLLRRADFHVGAHINTMWRVCTVSTDPGSGLPNKVYAKTHVTMFGTLDGAIGEVLPVSEKIYRRLLMLQNSLTVGVPHVAGLNPKAYRTARHEKSCLRNPARNVLDGDLLWKFTSLSFHERQEFARKIGTTSEQILNDLMDIQRATCVL